MPGLNINNADWQEINLVGVYCTGSRFININMEQMQSVGSDFSFSRWTECSGSQSEFYGASMNSLIMENSDFQQGTFVHSSLSGCTFINTDLTGADFSYSRLENIDFIRCRLDKASFQYARCLSVNLKNCSMKGAHFKVLPVPAPSEKANPLLKLSSSDLSSLTSLPANNIFNLSSESLHMKDINKRFRELVKQYHPDLYHNTSPSEKKEAAEKFLQVQETYLSLCEKLNRKKDFAQNTVLTKENLLIILKQNPKNEVAWYNLGILYFQDMDYDLSIECYEKALHLNAGNTAAQHNLKVTRLVRAIYKSVSSRI